ncbi:hypothetical protein [Haloarcula sp. CBA1127]|uniref:hypothetical protein n=1 Tax=Haloarcula sp. CBA1127 TaxID=1765055 RepID=UPI0012ABCD4F|nr:hypothetical protein [Haloarcula sp. CBA1127]
MAVSNWFFGKVATYAVAYFAQGLGRKPILRWEGDGFEVHYSPARNQLKAVKRDKTFLWKLWE